MIRDRKGKSIILGLSEENIKRLQDDQYIKFNLNILIPGQDYEVVIFAGKTDESMILMMQTLGKPLN